MVEDSLAKARLDLWIVDGTAKHKSNEIFEQVDGTTESRFIGNSRKADGTVKP